MSRTCHHSIKHGKRNRWSLGFNCYGTSPGWWVRLYMNRPKRHKDKAMIGMVIAGAIDAEAAVFAVGNRRPHKYYW
jgi:hypothetical protein